MTGEQAEPVPFEAHVQLLRHFLERRAEIVERILQVAVAQQKVGGSPQARGSLARQLEAGFFASAAPEQLRLRGQLEHAHRSRGFTPRNMPDVHNDLVDPAEMLIRALNFWRLSPWVGRHDRARFAQTLFNLYLLRSLELLSMRVCDAGPGSASQRLTAVQALLEELWTSAPADQPALVKDARWLIPIAQSPTTDELAPYFEAAERVAASLPAEDRLQIMSATVVLAGGHLRSQLRHYEMQGTPLESREVVLKSRRSNALDFAMTVQGLATLLASYGAAVERGDGERRLALAAVICQGISADPELFVNRIELLGPYSMIQHLFVAIDRDGRAAYTPTGRRHVGLLHEYATLMARLAPQLHADCAGLRPVPGAYSPLGVLYGFSSNITEHLAMKTLLRDPPPPFSLEDAFTHGDARKLEWVGGWRRLPHVQPEVQQLFEYPQQFAERIFARIEQALRVRAAGDRREAPGRLYVIDEEDTVGGARAAQIPELPVQYIVSSDAEIVAAHEAHACDLVSLLRDRQEGELAVSFETQGGWAAISKDFFTDILAAGRDVKVTGLPAEIAGVLRLMGLDLVAGESKP